MPSAASRNRSPERVQFLADVLVIGVETGFEWFAWSEYHHAYTGDGTTNATTRATCYPDDAPGRVARKLLIDVSRVASALSVVCAGGVKGMGDPLRDRILRANRANDAGDLDAFDADALLQVAVYGEVVFG